MATKLDKQRAISIAVAILYSQDAESDFVGSCAPADVGMTPTEFGRALALLFRVGAITTISSGTVASDAVSLVTGEGGR